MEWHFVKIFIMVKLSICYGNKKNKENNNNNNNNNNNPCKAVTKSCHHLYYNDTKKTFLEVIQSILDCDSGACTERNEVIRGK